MKARRAALLMRKTRAEFRSETALLAACVHRQRAGVGHVIEKPSARQRRYSANARLSAITRAELVAEAMSGRLQRETTALIVLLCSLGNVTVGQRRKLSAAGARLTMNTAHHAARLMGELSGMREYLQGVRP